MSETFLAATTAVLFIGIFVINKFHPFYNNKKDADIVSTKEDPTEDYFTADSYQSWKKAK